MKKKSESNTLNGSQTKSLMLNLAGTSNSINSKSMRKSESTSKANNKKSKITVNLNNNYNQSSFIQTSPKYQISLSILDKNNSKENSFILSSVNQTINENTDSNFNSLNSPGYLSASNFSSAPPSSITLTTQVLHDNNEPATSSYANSHFYQPNRIQTSSVKNFENNISAQNNDSSNNIHNFYYQQQNQSNTTSQLISNGYSNQHIYPQNYQVQLQQPNNQNYQQYYYYPTPESSPDVQFQFLNDAAALTAVANQHFITSNNNLNITRNNPMAYNFTTNNCSQFSNFNNCQVSNLNLQSFCKKPANLTSPSTSSNSSSPSSSLSSTSTNSVHNQLELPNNLNESSLNNTVNLNSHQESNSTNVFYSSLNNYNYTCANNMTYEKTNHHENSTYIPISNLHLENRNNLHLKESKEDMANPKSHLSISNDLATKPNNISSNNLFVSNKPPLKFKLDSKKSDINEETSNNF